MKRYGQYCPVSRAAEVLGERWTLLVIRELLWGNERFNAIARGVPRMSASLLSARLRELQRSGLVQRDIVDGEPRYRLTAASAELLPILEQIGMWGQRWMQRLRPEDLDPTLLMLDMSREIDSGRLPERAVTVVLELAGAPAHQERWWLVLSRAGVDVCDTDPGFPVAVWAHTDLATLTGIWLGDVSWEQALRDETLWLDGDATARRALPRWLGVSRFAAVERATVSLPR
ncbi:MAG: helix-turn-helix transcriptional regulator [Pseudonocardia sp.]|nr:helix-turn-helix transcriptional regulator [Pseudonocardia sp.]